MKIQDLIERADRLRPNTHDEQDKLHWLSVVESHVVRHINLHEGEEKPEREFASLEEVPSLTGTDAELYVLYLVMMYDYYNGDYDRYNNGAMQYNAALQDWRARYRREHRHKDMGRMVNLV